MQRRTRFWRSNHVTGQNVMPIRWQRMTSNRCQFHQHFMRSFFVRKSFLAAFSSYVLSSVKNSYKKCVLKTLMKLTAEVKQIARTATEHRFVEEECHTNDGNAQEKSRSCQNADCCVSSSVNVINCWFLSVDFLFVIILCFNFDRNFFTDVFQ